MKAKREIVAWNVRTWMQGQTPRVAEYKTEDEARAVYARALASRVYMQVHIEPVFKRLA